MLTEMDQQQFGAAVERYRAELHAYCYRLTGALQDAEDMVQETLLRAWKRRETFTRDISLRAWLYRIATNACLDALKKRRRRVIPVMLGSEADASAGIPAEILDPIWLEPYPDELLEHPADAPEHAIIEREDIRIAFLAALQHLPPRQRAILLLSDVLDYPAEEIAAVLETSVSAVKSALHRARGTLKALRTTDAPLSTPALPTAEVQALLDRYVHAWQSADIDAFVRLLSDDATFSMPPIPSWYRGRDSIRQLVARTIFSGEATRRWVLRPTRANAQTAFGLYRAAEASTYRAYGIQVVTLRGRQVSDVLTFRVPGLVTRFGLPESLILTPQ